MHSSTVKREKLIHPIHIALIGGLFALSFYLLKPADDALEYAGVDALGVTELSPSSTRYVDELDLAYIRARSAAGKKSATEIVSAAIALVQSGHVDKAKALLDEHPELSLDSHERFAIELEIAAYEYLQDFPGTDQSIGDSKILAKLEMLLLNPPMHKKRSMERAAQIALQTQHPAMAAEFYLKLAELDNSRKSHWYEQCAVTQMELGNYLQSAQCFNEAVLSANSVDQSLALRSKSLIVLSLSQNHLLLDQEITQLSQFDELTIDQMQSLAKAFLGVERPEQAARMFERLAVADNEKSVHWYSEAATWAQAANRIDLASQYIDAAVSNANGEQKQQLTARADSLLLATGKNKQAYDRVKARILVSSEDTSLLRQGIAMARQFNDLQQAYNWNALLLDAMPNDIESMSLQVQLALGLQMLDEAKIMAFKAVHANPDNAEARLSLAQLYEWTGEPVNAMQQWQWLSDNNADAESYRQLIRLANINRDSQVASAATQALVMLEPPGNELVLSLISAFELEGLPLAAVDALNRLSVRYGDRPFISQELAKLYQRHLLYPEALAAWQHFVSLYGNNNESRLALIELHWRLNQQDQAAQLAVVLPIDGQLQQATEYQVGLLSEIAWRYRNAELAAFVQPYIEKIENEASQIRMSQRLIQSLESSGKKQAAINEAVKLWQSSQSTQSALLAFGLAIKVDDKNVVQQMMARTSENVSLRQNIEYWLLVASVHLQNAEPEAAVLAYNKALQMEPNNESALSGLLWLHIGEQDTQAIAAFHRQYQSEMHALPTLWPAVAISYLQLGKPQQSLFWFDKQIETIDADYGMLLSYADALEAVGHAENAHKVRLYTLRKLRPLVAKEAGEDQSAILRQFVQLLGRYASAEEFEQVVQQLSDSADQLTGPDKFWREDIAISWLMSTQRHEHARLIMSRVHDKRLKTPVWQALALAMHQQDIPTIRNIIAGSGQVSLGNQILALRAVGNERQAFVLANNALVSAPSKSDRDVALEQYVSMRASRPSFSAGTVSSTTLKGLAFSQAGVQARHTLPGSNFGFGFNYFKRNYSSKEFAFANDIVREHIALSMHFGDSLLGGRIEAGVINASDADTLFASTQYHLRSRRGDKQINAEIAYNEEATQSAELRLAALQNRVTVDAESTIGKREFVRLKADVNEISTRVAEKKVALGLAAEVEVGVRGAFGSNNWSTSIRANRTQYDHEATLPDELQLRPDSAMSSVVGDDATTLSLGASIARGGVRENFPLAGSPRYYLNASLGQSWPSSTLGFQIDAGAGIRILGADELSIGFSHDTQSGQTGQNNDATELGVHYRYHF